jgi:hypothetical protein
VANSTVSPGLRDLALFLNDERGKQKWSTIDGSDIEDLLNLQPNDLLLLALAATPAEQRELA